MKTLSHKFVTNIPRELEEGVLYISVDYASAIHKCCCGCGNEIVTPISQTGWELSFNGKTVSLNPSIGNWALPCKSHYWIINNKVEWSQAWDKKKIDALRKHEQKERDAYFSKIADDTKTEELPVVIKGMWARIKRWFS